MSNGVELDTISQAHLASRVHCTPGLSFRESTAARTTIPASSTPLERTKKQIAAERIQFFAACWALVLAGWNDGTTGPLLPRIQQVYNLNYTVVSMLFVCSCVGFVTGALINIPLSGRVSFGKLMAIGSALQVVAYSIQAPALDFPVLCVGYVINGVGIAIQDAQANGYVASLANNSEAKMGMLHAAYGLGAFIAPLVSTQFSQMNRWSFHYLTSLGLAVASVVLQIAVFRFRSHDECLTRIGQQPQEKSTSTDNNFKQIFRQKNVHILAVFSLIYVGVEVTIGGWIVSYIIDERGGGPDSGYISSGFFGGLMMGRLVLLWLNAKIGEWYAIFLYAILAIALELVVWLVPSLIGGGVAVSLVGVLLGPFFPIAMNQAGRILPAWLLTPSIGWIAGVSQAGSAVLPFITGALAQSKGIGSLQPFLVSLMGFMMVLWALVPRKGKHAD
ncbi:MFS general substrate transporter [Schizophyllum commune Loenen D]|nr:MFS general substrate transporter [Schizophyllum commune Loenen D]